MGRATSRVNYRLVGAVEITALLQRNLVRLLLVTVPNSRTQCHTMHLKHQTAIRALLDQLKDSPPEQREDLYWSLKVLAEDLMRFFDDHASNNNYMKGKVALFIDACKAIACLEEAQGWDPIHTAESQFQNLCILGQWKEMNSSDVKELR